MNSFQKNANFYWIILEKWNTSCNNDFGRHGKSLFEWLPNQCSAGTIWRLNVQSGSENTSGNFDLLNSKTNFPLIQICSYSFKSAGFSSQSHLFDALQWEKLQAGQPVLSAEAIHLFRVYKRHVRWEGTSQRHKSTCDTLMLLNSTQNSPVAAGWNPQLLAN